MSVFFSMSPHAFASHLFVSTLRSETGSLPTNGAPSNHHYVGQIVQEECLQAVCIRATYTLTRLENTTRRHNVKNCCNNDVIFLIFLVTNLRRRIYDAV